MSKVKGIKPIYLTDYGGDFHEVRTSPGNTDYLHKQCLGLSYLVIEILGQCVDALKRKCVDVYKRIQLVGFFSFL